MRTKFTLLLFFPLLLAGCANTCQLETYYKPKVIGEFVSDIEWTNYKLRIDVKDGFSISVFECGTAYRRPDNGPTSVCFVLHIDEGNLVALKNSTFKVLSQNGDYIGGGALKLNGTGNALSGRQEFLGGTDNNRPALSRMLSKKEGWKRHHLTLNLPVFSDAEFRVQLPTIEYNGKVLKDIIIQLHRVREQVCHTSV